MISTSRIRVNFKFAQFNCYYDYAQTGQEGYQYDRNPLKPGILSGTVKGSPAAPLLGNLTEYDNGASELMLGPLMFFLLYDDYIVGYRFTPLSLNNCVCDIFWFVRDDAVENIDYEINNLIWLWDTTTLADKEIISNNQKGVNSSFYSPGRLSLNGGFPEKFFRLVYQYITVAIQVITLNDIINHESNKPKIGFWKCWSISVGVMIGSGVFLLPSVLAPFGSISFLGWLVTGSAAILISLILGRLSSRTNRSGGFYVYTQDAFGDLPGFLIAWGYWLAIVFSITAISTAFVGYLGVYYSTNTAQVH